MVNARFGNDTPAPMGPQAWDPAQTLGDLANDEDGYSDEEDFEAYTEAILHPMDITARFDQDELQVVKQTFQSLP